MTRLEQIIHVAKKDLRNHRWILLAYAAVLVVATVAAWGWPHVADQPILMISVLAIPFSMFVVAVIVQADSAFRIDAFWATRPLSAASVLGAKLLAVLVAVVLPGIAAQAVALRGFSVSGSQLIRLLADTAVTDGILLLLAVAFAVFTADIKSFLAATVLTLIAVLLVAQLIDHGPGITVSRGWIIAASWAPAIILAGATAYLYATRDVQKARLLAVLAIILSVSGPRLDPPRRAIVRKPVQGLVTVVSAKLETRERPYRVALRLTLPDSNGRAVIETPTIYLVDSMGKQTYLGFPFPSVDLGERRPPLARGLRILNPIGFGDDTLSVVVEVTEEQASQLLAGKVSLHLAGAVRRQRASHLATISSIPGSRYRAPGAQFELDSTWLTQGMPNVSLRVAAVGDGGRGTVSISGPRDDYYEVDVEESADSADYSERLAPFLGGPTRAYMLVNPGRGEAMTMEARANSGGISPLPLAGGSGSTSQARLEAQQGIRDSSKVISADWVRGAELRVFDWNPARPREMDVPVKVVPVSPKERIIPYERPMHGMSTGAIRVGH